MYAFAPSLRDTLRQNLERFAPHTGDSDAAPARAAVAIIVAPGPRGEAAFLLTRRAAKLNRHAGQWALPGGRLDAGETLEAAARRETREEIGLHLAGEALLGRLDDYETRSGFVISPYVYWSEAAETDISLDPREVSALHRIPLAHLFTDGSPQFLEGDLPGRPILRLHLGRHRIHAPTAALLYQFREVALAGRPQRVAHFDQPDFARR